MLAGKVFLFPITDNYQTAIIAIAKLAMLNKLDNYVARSTFVKITFLVCDIHALDYQHCRKASQRKNE